jgi:flagellar biosynthesis anti-sigma factor FlgM
VPTINSNFPQPGSTIPVEKRTAAASTKNRNEQLLATNEPKADLRTDNDTLELSDQVQAALDEAEFDQRKVAEIRDAIARGAYPMDSMQITESFIALEKLL